MGKIKEVDWRKELEDDLRKLMVKHGLKHGSFSAEKPSSDEHVGMLITDKTILSFVQSVLAMGKLWQHGREEMRKVLNRFDTWGWHTIV